MDVRCDKCQARYRIDDARVGPQGLTMRCGKCQNTFKVLRPAESTGEAQPSAPAPAKPSAPAAVKPAAPSKAPPLKPTTSLTDESAGRTMMFGPVPTAPPKPAAKPPPEPAMNSTMVFGSAPVLPAGAAKTGLPVKAAPAKQRPATDQSAGNAGSTMVFGAAKASPQPAMPKATAHAAPPDDTSGSTMMFGSAPIPAQKLVGERAPAAAAPTATEEEASASQRESESDTSASAAPVHPEDAGSDAQLETEPEQALPGEQLGGDEGAETGESTEKPEGAFARPPPKGLLIGLGVGLAVLLIAVALVVGLKKSHRGPPPAALEALAQAQASADKDTLPSLAEAETQARAALDAAGPKGFSQGHAALAEIELQWFDALSDQVPFWSERSNKASQDGDEKKKAEADAKITELSAKAQEKLKAAFGVVQPAVKADPKSPELSLALADYYRAARSGSQMNKELKRAGVLKADESRVLFIQAAALQAQADDEGAEKALPKLKNALAASPQSARLHFRLALDYLALHQDAEAMKEVKETLRLSPQHERARLALEQLAAAPPAAAGPAANPK